MGDLLKLLKSAADETRLRILSVVESEPLSVGEILEILDMGQSRISRHLKILADAGFLESNRAGNRVYYGLSAASRQEPFVQELLANLSATAEDATYRGNGLAGGLIQDRRKLTGILELRKKETREHFQKYGRDHDRLQRAYVDADFYRKEIARELGKGAGIVVDLGCGTGELSALISAQARRIIGVDQSTKVLDLARKECPSGDFRLGELEHLPLKNEEADAVVASMVLHHLPDPLTGLREANRVLRKNGALVVADLKQHEDEEAQKELADFWPGFEKSRLETMIRDSGFEITEQRSGKGSGRLTCLIYRAKKTK